MFDIFYLSWYFEMRWGGLQCIIYDIINVSINVKKIKQESFFIHMWELNWVAALFSSGFLSEVKADFIWIFPICIKVWMWDMKTDIHINVMEIGDARC